ncbi:hypothetical protein BS47DRAFT_1072908 [Hydnum rufescens UP504]|uniref:Uncharacterized protein n=1 Tax=Hydnum rufescens UP504 TaxID=1448309 RepID=A0A9P6DZK5_9AGAM|nr:hypothetical protein BS47DRAFT_1072908 [Hydnum rufescens UP504]
MQNAAKGLREHVAHGLEQVKNLEHDLKARLALMPSRHEGEGDKNEEKPNDSSNHDIENAHDWSRDVERIQAESQAGLRHERPRRASQDDNVDATEHDPDYDKNNDDEDTIDPPSRDGPSRRHSRSMVPKPLEKKVTKSPKSSLGASLRKRLFGPSHEGSRVQSGTASPRAASIRPNDHEGNRDGAEGDQGAGKPGELSLEESPGSPSHPPSPTMDRSPPPTPGTFGNASPSNFDLRSQSVSRDEGTSTQESQTTLPSAAVLRQRLSLHLIGADRPGYAHAHHRSESPGGRSIRFVGDAQNDASHAMPRGGPPHRHQHLHYTHRPTSSGSAKSAKSGKSGRLPTPPGPPASVASLPHSGSMPLVASGTTGYGNNDVEEGARGVTFDLPHERRGSSSESPSTTTPPTPNSKRA